MCINKTTYWLAKEGIITSHDQGARPGRCRALRSDAGWGPLFGRDEKQMMVADFKGFHKRTVDGGQTWQSLAPMPPFKEMPPKQPGQFLSIAWDSANHYLYASRMANATYRLQLK